MVRDDGVGSVSEDKSVNDTDSSDGGEDESADDTDSSGGEVNSADGTG